MKSQLIPNINARKLDWSKDWNPWHQTGHHGWMCEQYWCPSTMLHDDDDGYNKKSVKYSMYMIQVKFDFRLNLI